jgi:hypothetical protein
MPQQERAESHPRIVDRGDAAWRAQWLRVVSLGVLLSLVWSLPMVATADDGSEGSTTPTTQPAAPDLGEGALLQAACPGCIAAWGIWPAFLHVRFLRESRVDAVVARVHVHGAIIKPNNCGATWREGQQIDTFTKTGINTSTWQTYDELHWRGFHNSWGNAGAHEWTAGGVNYFAGQDGSTDICHNL